MSVIVDTSVWSLSLRRRRADLAPPEIAIVRELADLIADNLAVLLGPVRQEILSGIREETSFERLHAVDLS